MVVAMKITVFCDVAPIVSYKKASLNNPSIKIILCMLSHYREICCIFHLQGGPVTFTLTMKEDVTSEYW
jgi:hypothetical protein